GLSDPVSPSEPPTLEQWVSDGIGVLDAVGMRRPTVVGLDAAGSHVAMMFAAAHPTRVSSLVLFQPQPRPTIAEDWPYGVIAPDRIETQLDNIQQSIIDGLPRYEADVTGA